MPRHAVARTFPEAVKVKTEETVCLMLIRMDHSFTKVVLSDRSVMLCDGGSTALQTALEHTANRGPARAATGTTTTPPQSRTVPAGTRKTPGVHSPTARLTKRDPWGECGLELEAERLWLSLRLRTVDFRSRRHLRLVCLERCGCWYRATCVVCASEFVQVRKCERVVLRVPLVVPVVMSRGVRAKRDAVKREKPSDVAYFHAGEQGQAQMVHLDAAMLRKGIKEREVQIVDEHIVRGEDG